MNQVTHSEDAKYNVGPPQKKLDSIEVFSLNITTVELYGFFDTQITSNYFTSSYPHHGIYTFCYWQISWQGWGITIAFMGWYAKPN